MIDLKTCFTLDISKNVLDVIIIKIETRIDMEKQAFKIEMSLLKKKLNIVLREN